MNHAETSPGVELGAADCNASFRELIAVREPAADLLSPWPGTDQNGDLSFRVLFVRLDDDVFNDPGFVFIIAFGMEMGADFGPPCGCATTHGTRVRTHFRVLFALTGGGQRGRVGNRRGNRVFPVGKNVGKHLVVPRNQRRGGAEVDLQPQQLGMQRRQPTLAHLQVAPHVRLAEAIDGLHRVAHHKKSASVPLLPFLHHAFQQFELGGGSVLKFVHQDMVQAGIQALGQ